MSGHRVDCSITIDGKVAFSLEFTIIHHVSGVLEINEEEIYTAGSEACIVASSAAHVYAMVMKNIARYLHGTGDNTGDLGRTVRVDGLDPYSQSDN